MNENEAMLDQKDGHLNSPLRGAGRLVVLGAGESGIGAALLAKKKVTMYL